MKIRTDRISGTLRFRFCCTTLSGIVARIVAPAQLVERSVPYMNHLVLEKTLGGRAVTCPTLASRRVAVRIERGVMKRGQM